MATPSSPPDLVALYWRRLTNLKGACYAIEIRRDQLSFASNCSAAIRAIAASAALASWPLFKANPIIPALVVGATHVVDVIERVLPLRRRHEEAIKLAAYLQLLFAEIEGDWPDVSRAVLTEAEVTKRLKRLGKEQIQAEQRAGMTGWRPGARTSELANQRALAYLAETYEIGA